MARRLLPAVLLLASCAAPHPPLPPRPEHPEVAACNRARAAVADAAGKAGCTEDWECISFRPHLAGCGRFAPAGFASAELRDALEDACARFSLAPQCPDAVGVCAAGRCAWRPPRREVPCLEARQNLARALREETACAADRDCAVAWEASPQVAAPAAWAERFARERHPVRDACRPGESQEERAKGDEIAAACRAGRCAVVPLRSLASPPGGFVPPGQAEEKCVSRGLEVPAAFQGLHARMEVKFFVSPRGIPQQFSFPLTYPEFGPVERAAVEAISRCAWTPGRDREGQPASIWVVLPLRFEAR